MSSTSRRDVLRTGISLGAGIAAGKSLSPKEVHAQSAGEHSRGREREYTFGHRILFMEEYHQGAMEILRKLSGELDHIGELTSRAASVIRNGGAVWTSMDDGHMPKAELKETRRGCPGIMKDHSQKEFDKLQKGDMVFTNRCARAVQAARDRGVYVVSVTVNYTNDEFRPQGYTLPNEDNLMLKDVSNDILHSHIPYNMGLVHAPEIPEIPICPSTTIGSGTLHWMLNAELANKVADANAKEVDKSAEYIRILIDRVERIRHHMGRIREAATTMAYRIMDGGRWFVKSLEHPGLESELSYVECGPWIVNKGDWDAKNDKNVMLINAISPKYPDEVKLAMEKQVEGAFVIGIGPGSLDGQVPAGRLIDIVDAGFDNFSPESGGVIGIRGRSDTICPTSGIVGNVIQQMICAQWTDEMVRRGKVPYYHVGVRQIGGREYNEAMKMFFERQGF